MARTFRLEKFCSVVGQRASKWKDGPSALPEKAVDMEQGMRRFDGAWVGKNRWMTAWLWSLSKGVPTAPHLTRSLTWHMGAHATFYCTVFQSIRTPAVLYSALCFMTHFACQMERDHVLQWQPEPQMHSTGRPRTCAIDRLHWRLHWAKNVFWCEFCAFSLSLFGTLHEASHPSRFNMDHPHETRQDMTGHFRNSMCHPPSETPVSMS